MNELTDAQREFLRFLLSLPTDGELRAAGNETVDFFVVLAYPDGLG